jgi:hypothetical protein
MNRTVTITLDGRLTQRLQRLDDAQLQRMVTNFLRTHAISEAELDAGYAAMAADEEHEREAMEWIEFAPNEGLEDLEDDWSEFQQSTATDTGGDVSV